MDEEVETLNSSSALKCGCAVPGPEGVSGKRTPSRRAMCAINTGAISRRSRLEVRHRPWTCVYGELWGRRGRAGEQGGILGRVPALQPPLPNVQVHRCMAYLFGKTAPPTFGYVNPSAFLLVSACSTQNMQCLIILSKISKWFGPRLDQRNFT